jgi:hypothetical protein
VVSEKYNCLYIHIPKTAGQSVETFFLSLHGLTWEERDALLLKHNPDPALGPERLAHLKASEYVDLGFVPPDAYDGYYKFSFVRNPWDRLVSEYKYGRYKRESDFKAFVRSGLPEKDDYSDEYRHIIPQYDYLYHADGRLLVDFVGKFEHLQRDFDRVCAKLGIEESTLPHVNAARHKKGTKKKILGMFAKKPPPKRHYTSYYDDETKAIVGEMYAVDIATFGYTFGE